MVIPRWNPVGSYLHLLKVKALTVVSKDFYFMKMSRSQLRQNSPENSQKHCYGRFHALKRILLFLLALCYPVGVDFGPEWLLAEQMPGRKPYGDPILVERLPSGPNGGQAYRLTYTANVPIDVYWRFKTDFDNDFLKENKFILSHRFISRENNTVITENEYTSKPKVVFRWKTTFSSRNYRLEFVLLNPEATGHNFHYGNIFLNPEGDTTRVVQEAYFNFFGASFWAIYPWSGGMTEFLKYTAQWEQEMILKLYNQYAR